MDSLSSTLTSSAGFRAKKQVGVDISDMFSTYVYTGNGTSQSIVNGIDLATDGGMVWIKCRDVINEHVIHDTERGATNYLHTSTTGAEATYSGALTSFNVDGFSVGDWGAVNHQSAMSSHSFKKQPRFFDMVKYTGDGVAGREIAHNLGCDVGMILVKRTDSGSTDSWAVYHRSMGETQAAHLDLTNAFTAQSNKWNNTAPTSTQITLGNGLAVNANNGTYVAYLFAHDPLGESGDGSDGMIACGSFTTDGSNQASVNLGFEPQYLLVKRTDTSGDWYIYDTIRGFTQYGLNSEYLRPNLSNALALSTAWTCTPTGFDLTAAVANATFIYMAIRRPMRTPTSSSEVFAIDTRGSTADGKTPAYRSTFAVDMSLYNKDIDGSSTSVGTRLTQGKELYTDTTGAEAISNETLFDHMNGMLDFTNTDATKYSWMFKRATGFFDVVCYTGDGLAGRTVNHNLGVVPEMMWVKSRSNAIRWVVYHKEITATGYLLLNENWGTSISIDPWNNTEPTDAVFTVEDGTQANATGYTYIAYLFATLANVSCVTSYVGDGTSDSSKVIDCGFTTGSKFVLIKASSTTGDWMMWDATRGIVAGTDPYLELNTTNAEVTTEDAIDPTSVGFIVNEVTGSNVNTNGVTYIVYSVAS